MAKTTRPKTMREIQAEKASASISAEVTIMNVSSQLVPIHLKSPKGVDFYIGAQDIRLKRGQVHKFKKSRLWMEQVERLQKQGKIQVISDTEKIAEQAARQAEQAAQQPQ